MTDDQAQKPDASPREWKIAVITAAEKGSAMFDMTHGSKSVHVIEKSAYDEQKKEIEALMRNECGCLDDLAAAEAERDALSARVAELERVHEGCSSLAIRLDAATASYQKQVDINQKLVSELAAAQAENIGNLQLIGGMDERIKELEADNLLALSIADKFANERDEMKVREQKLVAAFGMLKLELRVKADGTQLKCTCGRPNCYSGHFNHGDVVYRVHYNEIQRFEEIVEQALKGGA